MLLLFSNYFDLNVILVDKVLVLSFSGGICEKNTSILESVLSSISL